MVFGDPKSHPGADDTEACQMSAFQYGKEKTSIGSGIVIGSAFEQCRKD